MTENDLLQMALNLGSGWEVDHVEFNLEDKSFCNPFPFFRVLIIYFTIVESMKMKWHSYIQTNISLLLY